ETGAAVSSSLHTMTPFSVVIAAVNFPLPLGKPASASSSLNLSALPIGSNAPNVCVAGAPGSRVQFASAVGTSPGGVEPLSFGGLGAGTEAVRGQPPSFRV